MKGINGEPLLSPQGRINGWTYTFYILGSNILYLVFGNIIPIVFGTKSVVGLVLVLRLVFSFLSIIIANGIKRFHDLGKDGWNMLLLLIPLYNIIVGFKLFFGLGDKGTNKYGKKPEATRKGMKIITLVLFILYIATFFVLHVVRDKTITDVQQGTGNQISNDLQQGTGGI